MTIGNEVWPPNMYLIFAMWLMIWSMASRAKFTVISSAIGRSPHSRAYSHADDGVFRYGRILDPLFPELGKESAGHERPLVKSHILTPGNRRVTAHLFPECRFRASR
jgi:hypothetical protein